jgi:outer membrane protein assembly factor BamB
MVYQDKVIFFNSQQAENLEPGQTPGTSRVIAVFSKDGTDAWTANLTATRTCYAVPTVFTGADGKDQIVSCNTGDGFFSLDPETGKRNWSTLPFKMRTVAATLVADGLVIGSNGSGGGGNYLVAIRPATDSVSKTPEAVYTLQKSNYVPSPVAVNGKLFFFTDKGIGNCVDLKTGELNWQQRISSGFSGSPVANQENIYIMDEDGNVYVIAASDKFKLIGKHPLGESSRATPAIWDNKLYFRTESKLFCVGK